MPAITLLTYNLATTANPNAAALRFALSTKHTPRKADFLNPVITVSTAMKDAIGATFALLGLFVECDKGDGQLAPLLSSETAPLIEIGGSLDSYGRTARFTRLGDNLSPLSSSLLRSRLPVRIVGYAGKPGNVKSRTLFDGFTWRQTFSAYPQSAEIECQDTSLLYASNKLAYNLPPGSLKSRKDVLLEMLAAGGFPNTAIGTLDLGPDDGGTVFKGYSFGGDSLLFDVIRDFLTPIGRRIKWTRHTLNVLNFDGSLPVQRTLGSGDIRNLTIVAPATNEANQVVMSATVFAYIGPTGRRTEYKVTSTRATYAPKIALRVQDHTSGIISDVALTSAAVDREVSRVETWTEYDGGTIVGQTVREWAWYTARACAIQQDGSGVISYNSIFDVFQYDDGLWRQDAQETFRMVRQSSLYRAFDAVTGILTNENLLAYRYLPLEDPIANFTDNAGTEAFINGQFIAPDGLAWKDGVEKFDVFGQPTDITTTSYWPDESGAKIAALFAIVSVRAFSSGTNFQPKPAYSPITDFASYKIMGPAAAKRYAYFEWPFFSIALPPPQPVVSLSYTASYAPIDEQSYRKTIVPNLFQNWGSIEAALLPSFISGSSVVIGVIPQIDRLTSHQTAQPSTQTVTDQVRSDLNGTVRDPQQNDYCETAAELQTAGLEILRARGAVIVSFDMPVDCLTEEGHTLEMDIPGLGGVVNLIAWQSEATFNGQTAENNQHLNCRWYPPELA